MSRIKKLAANTALFAASNFGSKLLTFLLVPFYTHVLTTEQYGTVDLIVSMVAMLLPVVTLSIAEAALRFAMDPEVDERDAYTCALTVVLVGSGLSLVLIPLISAVFQLNSYWLLIFVILFFNSLHLLSAQFSHGISKNVQFAVAGVVQTVVLVGANLLFLLKFKLGILGYLYSLALSYVIPFLFLFFSCRLWRYIRFHLKRETLRQMIRYSFPLIPNTMFWWAMNAMDKYFIVLILGASFNGLYAVSHKIPTILNTFNVIFFQAWQLSAIEEVNAKDRAVYYGKAFSALSTVMLWLMSAICLILRPLFRVWTAPEYYSTWQYTPILLFSTLFMCFASFWGSNYIALKKTGGIMRSAGVGAAVNLVLNWLLIPRLELYGAALSTAAGFLATWLVRVWDCRKELPMRIDYRKLGVCILLLLLQMFLLYQEHYLLWQIGLFGAVTAVCFTTVRELLQKLLQKRTARRSKERE